MIRQSSSLVSRLTSNAGLRIATFSTTSLKQNQENSQVNKVSEDVDTLFGFDNEASNALKSQDNEQPERKNRFNVGLVFAII